MRFQGMLSTSLEVVVSDTDFGHQLGNSMSINVLQRLLVSLLPAAGLSPPGTLQDPWLSGEAQQELIATVGKTVKRRRTSS